MGIVIAVTSGKGGTGKTSVTAGVAAYLPAVSGFLIQKELDFIGGALANPKRPLVAILGGSKVSSKIGVINNLLEIADTIIIGGGMSYTFRAAFGGKIGNSLFEPDWMDYCKEMVAKAEAKGVKMLLPVDTLCGDKFGPDANTMLVKAGEIVDGWEGMDIGPETIKLYISKQSDRFRPAYGRRLQEFPRQCIFIGTTNETQFLRDTTGNRRFWPVNVTGHGKHYPWELGNPDQIWAEAIEYYNQGEVLFLKGEIAAAAYAQQRAAMETDAREGIVQEYLDRLLPEGWDKYDLFQRRNYLNGNEFGGQTEEGTVQRTRVCAMEIWCECFGKPRDDGRNHLHCRANQQRQVLNKSTAKRKNQIHRSCR